MITYRSRVMSSIVVNLACFAIFQFPAKLSWIGDLKKSTYRTYGISFHSVYLLQRPFVWVYKMIPNDHLPGRVMSSMGVNLAHFAIFQFSAKLSWIKSSPIAAGPKIYEHGNKREQAKCPYVTLFIGVHDSQFCCVYIAIRNIYWTRHLSANVW